MKLIIESKQDYGEHIDKYNEEFECSVEKIEDMLKINFENGFIQIEKNKITYERNENKIIIEPGKINECDYETIHGMFVLDIKGLSVDTFINECYNFEENKVSGLIAEARYEIQMVGVEPYENNIRIIIE